MESQKKLNKPITRLKRISPHITSAKGLPSFGQEIQALQEMQLLLIKTLVGKNPKSVGKSNL